MVGTMLRSIGPILKGWIRLTLRWLWVSLKLGWRSSRRCLVWVWQHPGGALDGFVALSCVVALASLLQPGRPVFDMAESLDCMTLNLYHEARGEPELGQVAVAQVVVNRVAHPRFPDSVCKVIRQGGEWPLGHCQFSWWCDGRSDAVEDLQALERVRGIARSVLRGGRADPTEGALWYHADYVSPSWRTAFDEGPTIGQHIFYRPKADD